MSAKLDRTVVPSANVLFKEVSGEAVLLDVSTETYFGLNDVGARMWREITSSASVAAALAVLEDVYDAPPEELARDLDEFVETLRSRGLVEVRGG